MNPQAAQKAGAQTRTARTDAAGNSSSGSGIPQEVLAALRTADFKTLLNQSKAAKQNHADVASAMNLEARRMVVRASGGLSVTGAGAANAEETSFVRSGAASWTAPVDTSDGMLEKAAPYMDIIRDASAVYGVPVNVIMAVIKAESDYQQYCVSHSGAMGLMQIMPVNAEEFGVTDSFDPRQNIMCGTEEIARHLRTYNGDLKLALAAYNTGAGNIRRRGVTSSSSQAYNSVPAAVREYADRVMRYAGLAS